MAPPTPVACGVSGCHFSTPMGAEMEHMLEFLRIHVQTVIVLAQEALRAPPEVSLQCVAGHCYYQLSIFLSTLFLSLICFPKVGQKQKMEKKREKKKRGKKMKVVDNNGQAMHGAR